MSHLLPCTIWAPALAQPKHRYRPGQPRTTQAPPKLGRPRVAPVAQKLPREPATKQIHAMTHGSKSEIEAESHKPWQDKAPTESP